MRISRALGLLLLSPLVLLLAVFFWGSLDIFVQAFQRRDAWTLAHFEAFFARSDYLRAFAVTHSIAVTTTIVSIAIAWPIANVMVRYPKARAWLIPLILTPLLTSLVVRSFGWMVLLGPSGAVNSFLIAIGVTDEPFRLLFNQLGVVIGLVQIFFPFAVFTIYNALTKIGPEMGEAAYSLGAGPLRTLWRVTLPLSATGIIHGASVVYLLAAGAVVTPLLLGGPRTQMLGTLVYNSIFRDFNYARASSVAIILTLSAFAVVLALVLLERFINRHLHAERS